MSCCDKKSIKMVPRSLQKQLSNQHSNLDRFGSQLGPILGRFWGPRWNQVGTKSLSKSIRKMIKKTITISMASRSIFGRFWPQLGGRGGSDELGFRYFLGSWCHLGAKMAPRSPQTPQGAILIDFWLIFWMIFVDIWLNFEPHLGWFLVWLASWLIGCLACRLVVWLVDC